MEILKKDGNRLYGVTKIENHPLLKDVVLFYTEDKLILYSGKYMII